MRRGEIRWYTFGLPDKRRPVLILTRNDVIDRLNEIIVVPATRTIRGLATEVVLTLDDGMPAVCALNFDHVSLVQQLESVQSCAIWQKRDGPKRRMRYSSRAVSADHPVDASRTGASINSF